MSYSGHNSMPADSSRRATAYDSGLIDGAFDDDKPPSSVPGNNNQQFDIFEWHPSYLGCMRYFLDHAQHDVSVQAVAALINIRLPCQWHLQPILSSTQIATSTSHAGSNWGDPSNGSNAPFSFARQTIQAQHRVTSASSSALAYVPLITYIRRLVVTGFDRPPVLHGFFGDGYQAGVGSLQECERRNYLFAAKSGGWATVKTQYDMGEGQTVPFLQPLQGVRIEEIEAAEKLWSQWLALEDWMVGPRAPAEERDEQRHGQGQRQGQAQGRT